MAGFDVANAHITEKTVYLEDNTRIYYPMVSFNANAYLGYKPGNRLGISLEPGFIQKGGIYKSPFNENAEDVRVQLNYTQIPALFDIYISNRLFFTLGPEFAGMVSAKAKSKSGSNSIYKLYDRHSEISGMAGFNYSILEFLDIGLRYSHALTPSRSMHFTDDFGIDIGESKEYNQYF